ncbi:MAG: hypothetical protein HY713_12000 [candidate division NC10 bacterium]|nr:hypothetical protein [candidate division NC10 bacterium]
MTTADWAVWGGLLSLAALIGWLEIRYLMRRDQEPDEENRWPEWWDRGSPVPRQGLRTILADRLAAAIRGLAKGPAIGPAPLPSPVGGSWRSSF